MQSEKVELYLSCRKLKHRDLLTKVHPQIQVFLRKGNENIPLGQTEVLKATSNPNFSTSVFTDYVFETDQRLIFEVLDLSMYHPFHTFEKIGKVETSLGRIMGAQKQLLILDIKNDAGKEVGKLIVQGEKTGRSKSSISWQWSGIKLMNTDGLFDKSDPFLRFMKIRGSNDYLQVHETEVIMDNLNPNWKPFSILDYKLCGADHQQPFRVECWDWEASKKFQYIGDCQLTLNDIKSGKNLFELHHPKKKKKTGTLKISNFSINQEYEFIDYIRGGQQLKVMVGIDFTKKTSPDPNGIYHQYQQAIYAVSQILLNYDYDQAIQVFGFGGIPRWPHLYNGNVSHCFPCTGNPQQKAVYGLDGIMNAYFHALQNVEPSGPACFSHLVQEVMQFCKFQKSQPNGVYTVLLIVTDGKIHDMEQTINSLIESSHLPFSIVIAGIGDENFKDMERLDGDNGLSNRQGKLAQRDLVQFVPFKKFQGNIQQLAQNVLAEIPDQLVTYMKLVGKKPNPAIQTDIKLLENSFQTQPSIDEAGFEQKLPLDEDQQENDQGRIYPSIQPVIIYNNQNALSNVDLNMRNSLNSPWELKKSELVVRYSLEPIGNPLQEKINLNTFDMDKSKPIPQEYPLKGINNQKPNQFYSYNTNPDNQPQYPPQQVTPNQFQYQYQNPNPNMYNQNQMYPGFGHNGVTYLG